MGVWSQTTWVRILTTQDIGGSSLLVQKVKNLPLMQETWVWSLSQEDPLEKVLATHSSIFAWRIPRTEEPGGLQSMGLQRVRHKWVTNIFTFKHMCVCVISYTCVYTMLGAHTWLWRRKLAFLALGLGQQTTKRSKVLLWAYLEKECCSEEKIFELRSEG